MFYPLFSLIGLLAAYGTAKALNMPQPPEKTRTGILVAGVIGMIIGAKLPVLISYGFHSEFIVSGRSLLGGLLGAFLTINLYKYFSKNRGNSFGGRFVIPLAVAVGFGKMGCYFNGCCAGNWIIPPQLAESLFQFSIAGLLYLFFKKTNRADLLFPLYLLSYLSMRFMIEFVRTEPRLAWNLTIYQLLALAFIPIMVALMIKRIKHV